MNVYERSEALLRARLSARRNREACVLLGLWLLRKHGPYGGGVGRVFAIPRIELAADARFQAQVGLTPARIRGAIVALLEAGLIRIAQASERISYRPGLVRNTPTQYELGPDFALFFPVARMKVTEDGGRAPLFVATWKNPLPRPMRLRPPRPTDLKEALEKQQAAEARKALNERLKAIGAGAAPLHPLTWKTSMMQRSW